MKRAFVRAFVATAATATLAICIANAQPSTDPNSAPNPYRVDEGWAKLTAGRNWGAVPGVDIDRDGKSVWVFDRCETADDCSASNLDPIQKFDASGKLVKSFGAGMFNYPHGIYIDRDDNIWVTDGRAQEQRQGPHGDEVLAGRKTADDAGHAGRRRAMTTSISMRRPTF